MKILIIGYGNLGKIYAETFLRQQITSREHLFVFCKNEGQAQAVSTNAHGQSFFAGENLFLQPDLILLAVKPQDAEKVFETARSYIHPKTLVLSVMAGISISLLQQKLGHNKIVRAMPNSPVSIGMGITGYSFSEALTEPEIKTAEQILSGTGKVLHFENEDMLDAVTALSGSGPAYVYYFLHCMIEAGTAMGFSQNVATVLARETMLGALQVCGQSEQDPLELIATVRSKGGTTEAAFRVFDRYQLGDTIVKGIHAAHQRAIELNAHLQIAKTP